MPRPRGLNTSLKPPYCSKDGGGVFYFLTNPAVDPADWRRSGVAGGTGSLLLQHLHPRSMSLNQTLTRVRACVQRGQVDAAIKLYRGLLVSMTNHPQINTELGVLLMQHRTPQDAVPFLGRAVASAPAAFEPWVFLVIAHQRCGDLLRARQVLAQMQAQGFDATRLAVYEQELNEPTPAQLIDSGNHVSAEIAARMMVSDYPSSATARDFLQRVLQQGEPQV